MRREALSVCALLMAFVALNAATYWWTPVVWSDDAHYAFTAAGLFYTRPHAFLDLFCPPPGIFWPGSVPLHQAALYFWFCLFDFSLASARSLNYVFTAAGAFFCWWGVRRLGLIATARWRFYFLLLLLGAYGMTMMTRSGRYDAMGFFLCGILLAACSWKGIWRDLGIGLTGFLFPFAGLGLLPLGFYLALSAGFAAGKKFLKETLFFVSGLSLGALGFFALYRSRGEWSNFLIYLKGRTFIDQSFVGKTGEILRYWGEGSQLLFDFSYAAIAVVFAFCLFLKVRRREAVSRWVWFGFAAALDIPFLLYCLGQFHIFYAWMGFLPLAVSFVAFLERGEVERSRFWRFWQVFLAGVIVIGLPLRLLFVAPEISSRDYPALERFVQQQVKPDDRVFGDFAAFFAAKKISHHYVFPLFGDKEPRVPDDSTLLLLTDHAEEWLEKNPGWQPVAHFEKPAARLFSGTPLSLGYYLTAYRKERAV